MGRTPRLNLEIASPEHASPGLLVSLVRSAKDFATAIDRRSGRRFSSPIRTNSRIADTRLHILQQWEIARHMVRAECRAVFKWENYLPSRVSSAKALKPASPSLCIEFVLALRVIPFFPGRRGRTEQVLPNVVRVGHNCLPSCACDGPPKQ